MWIVINALLVYNIAVRSGRSRRVPQLGGQPSAQ
jgi:hypothetical protein